MKRIMSLCLSFLLIGCASSHVVREPIKPFTEIPQAKYAIKGIEDKSDKVVPEHFLDSIKGYLNAELKKRGMAVEEGTQINRDIAIQVTYYQMRTGFTRAMFGIMAGKDGVTSTVTVLDATTGEVMGTSDVDTYNVLAIGGEQDIARMHAEEIAKFLEGKTE